MLYWTFSHCIGQIKNSEKNKGEDSDESHINELLSVFLCGFRWNENYKNDLFSSRINTTKSLAKAISGSPSPPLSWVLITGVGM